MFAMCVLDNRIGYLNQHICEFNSIKIYPQMKNLKIYIWFLCIFFQKCNHDFSVLALLRVLAVLEHLHSTFALVTSELLPQFYLGVKNVYCPLFKFWEGVVNVSPFLLPQETFLKCGKYKTTKPAVSEQISGYLFFLFKAQEARKSSVIFLGLIYIF